MWKTFFLMFIYGKVVTQNIQTEPRVCIIGAGVSGLSASYYLKKGGFNNFDVFESQNSIGGTWQYDSRVGLDDYGFPIHTSMYKNLRTNLPVQTMEFPDYKTSDGISSFPTGSCFNAYIQSFADVFDLRKFVKFSHRIISVRRMDNKWKVAYVKVPENIVHERDYDYIFVCNGHNSHPNWPENIDGILRNFSGIITHSHDYREPQNFTDKSVLVVGAGPSAWDIGLEIATVAKKLVHSHHFNFAVETQFPPNYVKKLNVNFVVNNTVVFMDGSTEDVDVIIYCTGYHYYYPFLDESSGLNLTLQYISPLYKNTVNIKQPTMLFLGLGTRGVVTTAIHIQARYAAALIVGNFTLPSKEEMMEEWQNRINFLRDNEKPLKYLHDLGPNELEYYDGLANEAGVTKVSPAVYLMGIEATRAKVKNWYTFRLYKYKILNETLFSIKRNYNDTGNC